jgi:hypothetical protein
MGFVVRSEILEPPDFFRTNNWLGFDIRSDVFKIVLALAPVPDSVFCEGPGIDFEKERIQIQHMILLSTIDTKYSL